MDARIIMGICTRLQRRGFSSRRTSSLCPTTTIITIGGSANKRESGGESGCRSLSPISTTNLSNKHLVITPPFNNSNLNSNPSSNVYRGPHHHHRRTFSTFPSEALAESSSSKRKRRKESLDNLGTWDSATDLPLQVDATIASGKPIPAMRANNVGISSLKGRRTYMEDYYGVEHLNGDLSSLYVAVYDGHGSDACSKFCANIFPKHLAYWFQQPDMDVPAALHKTFLEVNNAFASWYLYNRRGRDFVSSGSTATVCIIKNSVELYIGHVGDSRAILCRSGEARKITIDHEPKLIVEKKRIEHSGGRISSTGRVNGRLNMSRSIGDHDLKRYGVIAAPDVITWRIDHSRDAFLVLTTDGINSVLTDNEIVALVQQTKDPQNAALLLTETAFAYSSQDNNTALVIPLGSWGSGSAAATIFHSFGKSLTSCSRFN